MRRVHLPRLANRDYRIEIIPPTYFDGARAGFGVQVVADAARRDGALLSLHQAMRAAGSERAGRVDLGEGPLVGFSMPARPEDAALRLGWTDDRLRVERNEVDLDDLGALKRRFVTHFLQLEDIAPFTPEILASNLHGATVRRTAFGRSFRMDGRTHCDWERHEDGHLKSENGRASLFLMARTDDDWDLLARNFLGELARDEAARFSTSDLTAILEIGQVEGGPRLDLGELRERIEAQIAFVRSRSQLSGRPMMSRVSTGFPPHEVRSGRKHQLAQFSTPPAVGEVAAEFVGGEGRRVLEPTIGNGVLVAAIAGRGAAVSGIEIDPARAARARAALPGAEVVEGDALDPASYPEGPFDAVLANPPFDRLDAPRRIGMATAPEGAPGVFPARSKQAVVALLAIDRLRAGGDAVLVMPAERNDPSTLTGERVQLQTMLVSSFEEVRTVALDAHLYRAMGSNFPVLVHFARGRFADGQGRGPGEAARLAAEWFPRPDDRRFERQDREQAVLFVPVASSFEDFYDFADREVLGREPGQDRAGVAPSPDAPGETPSAGEATAGAGDRGRDGIGRAASPRPDRAGPETEVDRPPGPAAGPDDPPVDETGPAWDSLDTSSWADPVWYVDDLTTDEFTTPYVPLSANARGARTVIERTMSSGTSRALQNAALDIEGTVDAYVAGKLGIDEEAILAEDGPLSPEQIDGLALTFSRREAGLASIVGDQMGVGKGRQLAAHAVSALMGEGRPVLFMSNRQNLFTDFAVRDLAAVSGRSFGEMLEAEGGGVRPFIMNAGSALVDGGRPVFATSPADQALARETENLEGYNLVMATYSQVQLASGAWRASALRNWISDAAEAGRPPILLLDEVHKAAGPDSRTGGVIRGVVDHAVTHGAAIVYSSATSVKSGKNLPVYAPALPDTGLTSEELLLAIDKMPLAMQEILSSEMAKSGSLIERKMSDAGVERALVKLADLDPDKMLAARRASDRVSTILQEMQAGSLDIRQAARRQFRSMVGGTAAAGSLDKLQVDTTSPATQLDAFSRYLMGSVKGLYTEELMVEAARRNEKATVVVEFTGDSVAEWLVEKHGDGRAFTGEAEIAVPEHPHMGHVLERFAERMLVVRGVDGYGERHEFEIAGFEGWLEGIRDRIAEARLADLRINVFDRVREAGEATGQTVQDISGRRWEFVERDGELRVRRREMPDPIQAAADYNEGRTDVLAFNSSAATGISLQNSPQHGADLRRRVMIKMAYQREITDERQVEGRINRTGQLAPPRYVIPVTGFAADDRIANLFNRANRNLTSSTSATRENRTNATHAVDILNPVGEMAARIVLERHPEVAETLGIDPRGHDLARKLLGRSIMLRLDEQGAILGEVDTAFRLYDEKLTAEGNNPLKLGRYDWKADVEEERVLIEGNPASASVAALPLVVNKLTYREPVVIRPPGAIEAQVREGQERRAREGGGPFRTLEETYGYRAAFSGGRPDLDHALFDDVMGRRSDEFRKVWPTPIGEEMGRFLLRRMDGNLEAARKRGADPSAPFGSDEVRAASESVGNDLVTKASRYMAFFDEQRTHRGEPAYEGFNFPLAIRTLWRQVKRTGEIGKMSELVAPGALVAFDRRALTRRTGGMFASAYDEAGASDGLVPAVVTSVAFPKDAPFAEAKMSVSFVVPGARGTERATLSSLRTAMDANGADGSAPIRPFVAFVNQAGGAAAVVRSGRLEAASEPVRALVSLYGEDGVGRLADELYEIGRAREGGLDGVSLLGRDGVVDRHGSLALRAVHDGLPREEQRRTRYTLEGNFFAGMAAISSRGGHALGEKIVYTDRGGASRNALLLNQKGTERIISQVAAKTAQRAVPLPKLRRAEEIGAFFTAAVSALSERPETVEARWRDTELADALAPGSEHPLGRAETTAVLTGVRSLLRGQDRTFPLSLAVGGDPWAWQAEHYRKQAAKAGRDARPLEPGTSSFTMVGEAASRVAVFRHDETSVRLILNNIASDQLLALHAGGHSAALIFKRTHPLVKENGRVGSAMVERAYDAFRFEGVSMKLGKGVLATELDLRRGEDTALLGEAVRAAAVPHRGEVLAAGAMRDVVQAVGRHAEEARRDAGQARSRALVERALAEEAKVAVEARRRPMDEVARPAMAGAMDAGGPGR